MKSSLTYCVAESLQTALRASHTDLPHRICPDQPTTDSQVEGIPDNVLRPARITWEASACGLLRINGRGCRQDETQMQANHDLGMRLVSSLNLSDGELKSAVKPGASTKDVIFYAAQCSPVGLSNELGTVGLSELETISNPTPFFSCRLSVVSYFSRYIKITTVSCDNTLVLSCLKS